MMSTLFCKLTEVCFVASLGFLCFFLGGGGGGGGGGDALLVHH